MRSFIRRIINYKIVKRNRLILNKLGSTSINYVDIGSVDPIFNRIRGLENIINYVGFDVNKNDKKFKGFNTFLQIDKLLYSNEVEVDFYHTNFSHCSSIYKPSQSFINRYEKLRDSLNRGKLVSADAVFFKKPEFLIGENMTNAYILLSFIYDKYGLAISLLEKLKINVDLLKYVKRIDNKERRTNKFSSNILKIVNLVTLKNNKSQIA